MWSYAKRGWSTARQSWFLLFLLFLYQYGWGFLLYKYVKSTVVPLLHRYPGAELSETASQLFWLEGQFQLMKTDLMTPYLWTFAIFICIRMTLTPLINGGLYNALHNGASGHRRAFFQGLKRFAKPFLLLYALQSLLVFAPLIWAVPRAIAAAAGAPEWPSMAASLLPYVFCWLAYQGVLELAFTYICFGIVTGGSAWASLGIFLRRLLPITGLALTVFFITCAIGLLTASVSLWWAGFAAVLLHQSYPLVRAMFRLWGISAQYHLWSSSRSSQ